MQLNQSSRQDPYFPDACESLWEFNFQENPIKEGAAITVVSHTYTFVIKKHFHFD